MNDLEKKDRPFARRAIDLPRERFSKTPGSSLWETLLPGERIGCGLLQDDYEGEGGLYRRITVTLTGRKGALPVQAYVYLGQVRGDPLWNKWQSTPEDPVWYVGYGSNI